MHNDTPQRNIAESEIRRRIAVEGRITFADFMETALYHPEGGYYTTHKAIGASGAYFTSPAAHPAFGALLALQLERMWETLGAPDTFHVVEMGAGDGLMARDLANYAQHLRPAFRQALEYLTTDRAKSDAAVTGITGCVISNELVDAFPVHRFKIANGNLQEAYVTINEIGELAEEFGQPSTPLIAERLEKLGRPLPDGFAGEVNLGISTWMENVSQILNRGFVITIDYGLEADQLYSPIRSRGTLQTYFRHTDGSSPYQRIGRQDITAHVDFTAVVVEGRTAGLAPLVLFSQAEYLNELGMREIETKISSMELDSYERDANLMALRELVKPGGLGGFLVLIQQKGAGVRGFDELIPDVSRIQNLDAPMLRAEHIPLFAGRYPQSEFTLDHLWPPDEPPN
ncbi:MAG: SAM-dependent methyltransferase [SAR202 cluster bacterium]|jgi:SAM-dependent MidA family methyltransferase|nr:SAM-dependent methyltransferase [SAR202 cluster bacterium]MDP6513637.1 SAM-dependent methyltransferase [SAR202 cluster bacterium]MDP6716100.1 SAM-dependent methyltransferase [SAR202 cluster bacterium]